MARTLITLRILGLSLFSCNTFRALSLVLSLEASYLLARGFNLTTYRPHDATVGSDPVTVKKYARRAQLGEIFELDRATLESDGVRQVADVATTGAARPCICSMFCPPFLQYDCGIFRLASPIVEDIKLWSFAWINNHGPDIEKKKLGSKKGKWAEELPYVLWADRTTPNNATGQTPFFLVFGPEAIIATEMMVPTVSHPGGGNTGARRSYLTTLGIKENTNMNFI
ncbi:hypothetical protein QVD17_19659 [Tagetes erecta]|uniref:Uncharacterized protein n=1 Tax=Tagetes erecta TaxID=13708 RepID=A0AAD8KQ48_TARER|nr:hypothetical protein QVD17_19659 [Tagetes erecta]